MLCKEIIIGTSMIMYSQYCIVSTGISVVIYMYMFLNER